MITILQGKDMAAMDSNGKFVWGYVFRQIKFVTEDWRLYKLRIICNDGDLALLSCLISFLTQASVALNDHSPRIVLISVHRIR